MKRLEIKKTVFVQLSLVFVTFSLLIATTANAQKYDLNTLDELKLEGGNSNYVGEINKIAQNISEPEYTITYENGELKDVSVTGTKDKFVPEYLDVAILNLKNNRRSNQPEKIGVFYTVDKNASYKGGQKALKEAIESKLEYPQDDLDWGVQGTVYINFVVDENGKIPYISATDDINPDMKWYKTELEQQAINAVKATSGKWIPAQKDGVKVASLAVVPIKFEEKLDPSLVGWIQ